MSDLPQFFIESDSIKNGEVLISGTDSHHLARVRRIRQGNKIMLRTGDGKGYMARVSRVTPEGIHASIFAELEPGGTLPDITLYMALLKGGNFEFVIQKTVEIGVSRIVPVITERTVPDPDKMTGKKLDRWEKIASEACKQCLRSDPALIEAPMSLKEVFSDETSGLKVICHPGADIQLKGVLNSSAERGGISLLIGPEGGFSDREISEASAAGWTAANLGATHLRAETAALVIPSIVIYEWS